MAVLLADFRGPCKSFSLASTGGVEGKGEGLAVIERVLYCGVSCWGWM